MTHKTASRSAPTRQIRLAQALFAGAAAVGALGLLGAGSPVPVAAPSTGFAIDDNGNWVNDNGQTPGDVFTQNAQDQSTADGAGTTP